MKALELCEEVFAGCNAGVTSCLSREVKLAKMLKVAIDGLEFYADTNFTSFDTSCELAKKYLEEIDRIGNE